MTLSVTDVMLRPTVPSVYFLTDKNSYKAPVKILASVYCFCLLAESYETINHYTFVPILDVKQILQKTLHGCDQPCIGAS